MACSGTALLFFLPANPGLEVRSCGNAILLSPPNIHTTMLRYFNNNNNNNDYDDDSVLSVTFIYLCADLTAQGPVTK
jgi:hypothetical protein